MGKFNLSDYEEVKDRLPKLFKIHPDARVTSEIIHNENGMVIIRSFIFKNAEEQALSCPLSTGIAYEKESEGYINKTSYIENCETSAIGRALANLTLHGDKRPSKEEMKKVERMSPKEDKVGEEELF